MKALELADQLDRDACDLTNPREAAAELRRLAAVESERDALKADETPEKQIKRTLRDLYQEVLAERDALKAELERIKALEPIGFVSQANMKFLSESAAKDWIPIWNTPTQDHWDTPTKASKIPLYALGSKTA